jgi:hypothetical protein
VLHRQVAHTVHLELPDFVQPDDAHVLDLLLVLGIERIGHS